MTVASLHNCVVEANPRVRRAQRLEQCRRIKPVVATSPKRGADSTGGRNTYNFCKFIGGRHKVEGFTWSSIQKCGDLVQLGL